jgi:cysteinyl-tRNA synthetase
VSAGDVEMVTLGGQPLPLLDRARIYVCGITPYDVTHLGHAATYVWVDLLVRVLRDRRVTPVVCRNVTDVDDVLTAAAQRVGRPHDQFAYLQQYDFDRDMTALRVRRPDLEPRARYHVDVVVDLAAQLLARGAAYESNGSVYFPGDAVAKAAGLDDAEALRLTAEFGGHPDDPGKRDPLDWPIWRAGDGDESWDSPWGRGRPGWHAECTAMAISSLGPSLDIHCGGADLRYPHHAFEAAMAEAFTGVHPFARAWMRVGVVGLDGAKMAKSTGNLVLVDDLLHDHPASSVRVMLLNRRWSEPWDYTPALLDEAAAVNESLTAAADRRGGDDAVADVRAALADDLDVPRAVLVALEAGGAAARHLLKLLASTDS